MKTKKLTPLTCAPLKRENVTNVVNQGNAIALLGHGYIQGYGFVPIAREGAE